MRPKAQNPSTKIQKNHDTSAPTAVIFCAVRVIFCRWPQRAECSKSRVDCDPNRPKYYCPFYRDVSKWHQKGLFTSRNRQRCHPENCHRPRKYAHKAGRDANKDRSCGNKDSNRLKINTIEQIRLSSLLHTSNLTLFRLHKKDKIPRALFGVKSAHHSPRAHKGRL